MTAAVHEGDWLAGAACLSADPDLFFPVSSSGPSVGQVAQAKAICAPLPGTAGVPAVRAGDPRGARGVGRH